MKKLPQSLIHYALTYLHNFPTKTCQKKQEKKGGTICANKQILNK